MMPWVVWMATKRRGAALAAARAGSMASRSGNPRETPTPRRKVRRFMAAAGMAVLSWKVFGVGWSLLDEHRAHQDLVDQGPQSMVVLGAGLQNAVHLGAVREGDGGAGGVMNELLQQVAGDLLLAGQQQLLELDDV